VVRFRLEPQPVHTHRSGDVLHDVLSEKLGLESQLPFHLVVGGTGQADPAGLGQALDAGSDVDAVAVEALPLEDHVS